MVPIDKVGESVNNSNLMVITDVFFAFQKANGTPPIPAPKINYSSHYRILVLLFYNLR